MVENPPWVEKILTDNWPDLERVVEADLLPKASVKPRGRVRRIDPGAEYGCGSYGCVMATGRPGIVCKLTSDPSEAEFVELAWERVGRVREDEGGDWPEGIVRYHQIISLAGSRRDRPVWMLWRDEAWDVGGAHDFLMRMISMAQRGMKPTPNDYERRELRGGIKRLDQFRWLARSVRMKARDNEVLLKNAVERFKSRIDHERAIELLGEDVNQEMMLSRLRGSMRVSTELAVLEYLLQIWTNEYGLNTIAQALDAFFDKGMLLADVHQQNIGRPTSSWRNDRMGDWLITDPGHLVKLW